MRGQFRAIAAAAVLACVAPLACADVLTFDDLPGGPTFFAASYDGFTFGTNAGDNSWFWTDAVTAYNLPHSGATYVSTDYTLYANDGSFQAAPAISNSLGFTFQGAWFSDDPAFPGDPDMITYELYSGATLVFTSSPSVALTAAPQYVASGYSGTITSVVIVGQQGYYAMDDFTYTAAAVPEPQTYALMLGGLLVLGMATRQRKLRAPLSF